MNTLIIIVEVLLLSLGISLAIKYLAPMLAISPSTPIALIFVLSPTLLVAIALLTRWSLTRSTKTN